MNDFSKGAADNINTQKSVAFLHTENELAERETKKTIPFTIVPKSTKHLGINLSKEVKDLCFQHVNNTDIDGTGRDHQRGSLERGFFFWFGPIHYLFRR